MRPGQSNDVEAPRDDDLAAGHRPGKRTVRLSSTRAGARRPWLTPWTGPTGSVRIRLTLWYVAILALVILLFGVGIYAAERQSLLSQFDTRVGARLRQLAGTYDARTGRLTGAPDGAIAQGDEIALLLTPEGQTIQVQAEGRLSAVKVPWDQVARTLRDVGLSATPAAVEEGLALTVPNGTAKAGASSSLTMAAIYRLMGMPLAVRGSVRALLVVGLRSDVAQQLAALTATLETVGPLVLLLCAGGGYWLAYRALSPVQTIARTARQISATARRVWAT